MKQLQKAGAAVAVCLILLLCLPAPTALAANATEVWVDNVKLDAAYPYWKNGEASAAVWLPEEEWNAYFDPVAGTLTLKDAQLDSLHQHTVYYCLLFAVGDLRIELEGTSTLQFSGDPPGTLLGVYIQGRLALSGDGSMDVNIFDLPGTAAVYGMYGDDLVIEGCALDMDIHSPGFARGIASFADISISDADLTITMDCEQGVGVHVMEGDFLMTGGSVTVKLHATRIGEALKAMKVDLQGGTGFFLADFAPNTVGMNTMNGEIGVSGGCFTFSGNEFALFASEASCTVEIKNVQTYVSENSLGRGKSLWTSGLTDELVTTLSQESAYRYVEFCMPAPPVPQTGDGARPWLWAGIAAVVLLGAVWAVNALRKKNKQAAPPEPNNE